jgi:SAM-dependent methyltransferase
MNEANKTNRVRSEEFKQTYFAGRVIDIGCGSDLVVSHAVPFDIEQGNAEHILKYFELESFDCVHSSHCLEHMRDVKAALKQWWALVRPGGYLILVVPHEDLYEQGYWPSLFNHDHKARFHIGKDGEKSSVSYEITVLVRNLPGAQIIDACIQDQGLDYNLLHKGTETGWVNFFFRNVLMISSYRKEFFRHLIPRGLGLNCLDRIADRFERLLGIPVDQTLGDALAQIQVVARKLNRPSKPSGDHASATSLHPR